MRVQGRKKVGSQRFFQASLVVALLAKYENRDED